MSDGVKRAITVLLPADELAEFDRLRAQQNLTSVDPEPGELEAIARGEAAIDRGEYVTLEELLDDLDTDRRAGGRKKSQANPLEPISVDEERRVG